MSLYANVTVWRCNSLNEPAVMTFRTWNENNIKIKNIACDAIDMPRFTLSCQKYPFFVLYDA